MASIAKVVAVGRLQVPRGCGATLVQKRDKSVSLTQGNYRRGTGGRSSFSGVVATVFGATGRMGHITVNKLGKTGSQVIIPYRCDPYYIGNFPLMGDLGQILFNKFNLRDEASIQKVVQYSNVVINLIGREYETKNFSFEDIYVEGPRKLARQCREAGVDKFIHISHLNAPVRSQNLLNNGSRLLKAKYAGEEAVLEEFPDATIVRPSDVITPGHGWFNMYNNAQIAIRTPAGRTFSLWQGGTKVHKMPVKDSDFTKGIEAIIRSKDSKGKIFQFVGPAAYTTHDLVEYINRSKLAYNYSYTSDFSVVLLRAQMKAKFYMKTQLGVPAISPDRLERETISDRLDENLLTLEDLGITPESIVPYMTYMLRPALPTSALVEQFGEIPKTPKPDPLYNTAREEMGSRQRIIQ